MMATILVVEDQVDANEILCRLIQKFGHRPRSSYNGEDGLAAIVAERPDLVILDQMMPGMEGTEVLRRLRANPKTASLPVVIYSALSDPKFQEHARQTGATEVWLKGGFDIHHLREMIERVLPRPSGDSPRA
jgi:CheY-like chemotaxis protein